MAVADESYEAEGGRRIIIPSRALESSPRPMFAAGDLHPLCDGVDDAGCGRFLDILNGPNLVRGFWPGIRALLFQRGTGTDPLRLPETVQEPLRKVLVALPPDIRIPIMAQRMWPRTRIRQWERLYRPMVDYLTSPAGDLRRLEVGLPKVGRIGDMSDSLLRQIAQNFDSRLRGGHGVARPPARPPVSLSDATTGGTAMSRSASLHLLGAWDGQRGGSGVPRAEINLAKTQAFYHVAQEMRSGIPEGHLMVLALSTKPAGPGWPDLSFDAFALDVVWPYVARHREILRSALGVAESLPFYPRLEPLKALKALTCLPSLPADMVDAVRRFRDDRSGTRRALARGLLDGA